MRYWNESVNSEKLIVNNANLKKATIHCIYDSLR